MAAAEGGKAAAAGGAESAEADHGGGALPETGVELVRADTPARSSPAISDSDYAAFISNINKFGLDLGQAMAAAEKLTDQNVVYSPLSATLALGMTYAGARGETAQEMKRVLGDAFMGDVFHAGCNRVTRELAARVRPGETSNPERNKIDFTFANSQFADRKLPLEPDFLQLLAAEYDSGVRRVDFARDPEAARQSINAWVSKQTHDTIQDLIPSGVIDSDTALVLVNALYFYASWQQPFSRSTDKASFTTLAGGARMVPVMSATRQLEHAETDELAIVELPYADGKLHMTIVLPRSGRFAAVREKVSSAWLDELTAKLSTKQVNLQLPKFRFDVDTFSLVEGLKTLGMRVAFTGGADFSGLSEKPLMVADVLQKAFISVDEEGTEASAATAVILAGSSAPAIVTPFTVDRPFLFFIRDGRDAILFSGQVVDPAGM